MQRIQIFSDTDYEEVVRQVNKFLGNNDCFGIELSTVMHQNGVIVYTVLVRYTKYGQ